jgi:tetraacyldisaccharide 4'-kinase
MIRSAPAFWGERPGLKAGMLAPLAAVWSTAGRLRDALARPYRAPVPVICVGNFIAGGAGKTPVALSLCTELRSRGVALHVVTRGYGGRLAGPLRVDPATHDAAAVGDEPLLLAAAAPCWVARRRAAGLRAAAAAGAELILLDDGLQNPTIVKTLSLVVVDGEYGFGNGRVIPAGPLREGLARGFARADAIVRIGEDAGALRERVDGRLPIVPAVLAPVAGERFAGARLFAFAGIARPQKFFAGLRRLDAVLAGERAFPDHHRFRPGEIAGLRREAERAGARLVTTTKDIVRMPIALRAGIEVLEVEIRWPEPALLASVLMPVLAAVVVGTASVPGPIRAAGAAPAAGVAAEGWPGHARP